MVTVFGRQPFSLGALVADIEDKAYTQFSDIMVQPLHRKDGCSSCHLKPAIRPEDLSSPVCFIFVITAVSVAQLKGQQLFTAPRCSSVGCQSIGVEVRVHRCRVHRWRAVHFAVLHPLQLSEPKAHTPLSDLMDQPLHIKDGYSYYHYQYVLQSCSSRRTIQIANLKSEPHVLSKERH